jgi:hypothetical protein
VKQGPRVRQGANQAYAPSPEFMEKSELKRWKEICEILIPKIKIVSKMYSTLNTFGH